MRDFRSILNIIGILICIEAVAMLIPMLFDLYYGNNDWLQFFYSSLIFFFLNEKYKIIPIKNVIKLE